MWGDYHARELALYLLRMIEDRPYLNFWSNRQMIVADLAQIAGRVYPARPQNAEHRGRREPHSGVEFRHRDGDARTERRAGAVAQPGAGRDLFHRRRHRARCAWARSGSRFHAGRRPTFLPRVFHQLTNTGSTPMRMIYCYGPAGDVAHWRQELAGTLPRAGVEAPPLPAGARPQHTAKPENS